MISLHKTTKYWVLTAVFLLLAHVMIQAANAAGFDVDKWGKLYENHMGDDNAHVTENVALVGAQGNLRIAIERHRHRYSETLSDESGRILAKIDYDSRRVLAKSRDGRAGNLTPDQRREFVTEIALMTNDVDSAHVADRGPVSEVPSLEKLRLTIVNGAPADLWVDPESGEIKMVFIVLSGGAVRFRPMVIGTTGHGGRFVALWQRDQEAPIRITNASLGE